MSGAYEFELVVLHHLSQLAEAAQLRRLLLLLNGPLAATGFCKLFSLSAI